MVISGRYLLLENKYYVILTVHDISKERVLKSSLQHSNEKFLCFFDNVTVGVCYLRQRWQVGGSE